MKNSYRLLSHVYLVFSVVNPLLAQWVQTNGPFGGYVNSITISDKNLFAGTFGGGVFLSTNNGTTWTHTALTNTYIVALAISGTTIIAGSYADAGILRSTDNGTTWSAINAGLTNNYVRALAYSGVNL